MKVRRDGRNNVKRLRYYFDFFFVDVLFCVWGGGGCTALVGDVYIRAAVRSGGELLSRGDVSYDMTL